MDNSCLSVGGLIVKVKRMDIYFLKSKLHKLLVLWNQLFVVFYNKYHKSLLLKKGELFSIGFILSCDLYVQHLCDVMKV